MFAGFARSFELYLERYESRYYLPVYWYEIDNLPTKSNLGSLTGVRIAWELNFYAQMDIK